MRSAREFYISSVGAVAAVVAFLGCASKSGCVANIDLAQFEPNEYGIEDVYFSADSYTLSDFGKDVLDKNARIMRKYSSIKYLIEGHVEQTGSPEYVFALGEMRAKIVRDYLVSLGVSAAGLTVCSNGYSAVSGGVSDEIVQTGNNRVHFARP